LEKQTIGEQQLLYRIATITDNDKNEPTNDKIIRNKFQKHEKWKICLIVHYKHEQRLAGYKKRSSSNMEQYIHSYSDLLHQINRRHL
jgi:hypothetical protein